MECDKFRIYIYFTVVTSKNCNDVTDCISIWWRCELNERLSRTSTRSRSCSGFRVHTAKCPQKCSLRNQKKREETYYPQRIYIVIFEMGWAYATHTHYTSHRVVAPSVQRHRQPHPVSMLYVNVLAHISALKLPKVAKLSKMCNRQPNNGAWNKARHGKISERVIWIDETT